ncbi:MAG: ribosome recycling factor [Candidatus Amesbacteria bacterium]|nr:ribosome recycling factor [Candidatus Amesbacteria bacterium]
MNLGDIPEKMQKTLEFVRGDIASIRTGRATSALVENIIIKAYGGSTQMRVLEMAGISTPDPQSLLITPYDSGTIGEIRRDIEAANIGLTPVIDNGVIRIAVPSLTSERRLEYVKMLHKKLEDGRVKIRQERHEKMTEFKRMAEAKELNEDDRFTAEAELQKLTDKMMLEIENIGKNKEEELMRV